MPKQVLRVRVLAEDERFTQACRSRFGQRGDRVRRHLHRVKNWPYGQLLR